MRDNKTTKLVDGGGGGERKNKMVEGESKSGNGAQHHPPAMPAGLNV